MLKIRPQLLTSRVISDLKTRSTIGVVFYVISLCITIFPDGYYLRHPSFSYQFMGFIFGICAFRLIHMAVDRYLPQNWINTAVFFTSVILNALIWGIGYAKFTLQPEEIYVQYLIVTCTVGLCAGGVVTFIPCLWLAWGFNVCIMVPGIISLMIFTNNYSLGFLFILFFLFMVFMAYRQNNEYWTALDNEYLLEKKSRELELLSNQDGLTGLYNRRYFDQTFFYEWKQAIRNKTSITVLMCDVDHFKRINDQYGHIAGDEYLKQITQILQQVFRRDTDFVSRYGGEEFVVLILDNSMDTIMNLAEKVRGLVESSPLEFEEKTIRTTISLGIANMIPKPGMTKETLISKADKALYSAKEQGRNQVVNFSD